MTKRSRSRKSVVKRFSVSLDAKTYNRVTSLAARHKPPLTLQYVVLSAVQRLLDSAEDPQLELGLTLPPLGKGR